MSAIHDTSLITALQWRKSSYSGANSNCVEVADGFPGAVPVRDSKDTSRAPMRFSTAAWSAFVDGLKRTER